MISIKIFILIAGGVLIFVSILILFYAILMKLKNEVDSKWLNLYKMLRKKQDMVPALIENLKQNTPKEKKLINETLKIRKNVYLNTNDETVAELDFTIKRALGLEKKYARLKHDLGFLELKNSFSENSEQVVRTAVEYNIAANKYNRLAKIALSKRAPVFEV